MCLAYSLGLNSLLKMSGFPSFSDPSTKLPREEFLVSPLMLPQDVHAYRPHEVVENLPSRAAPFRDGRAYSASMFSGVGAPSSYLYGQFPVQGFHFPLGKLTDAKSPFPDFAKVSAMHHKHGSPPDNPGDMLAEYARANAGGAPGHCHMAAYSSREVAREDGARKEGLPNGHQPVGLASRKHGFPGPAREQREAGKEHGPPAGEEDSSHQHYSLSGRKGLMSSPQSPLKSDCQPNSPTESSSSKNAAFPQATRSPPVQCAQDPKARNWKKYKFIVLNSANQSSKEDEGGPRDVEARTPRRVGSPAYLQPSDLESSDLQSAAKISEHGEDFPAPQASRLNNIINR